MNKFKPIKLRAFRVSNAVIDKKNSGLLNILSETLNGTVAKDRTMLLNVDDETKEQDLFSDYNYRENTSIAGTVLRIASGNDIPNIPDDYLYKEKITINELDSLDLPSTTIYKNHYYFLLNDSFLITNLTGNTTIKRFEVYVNWFLENVRKDQIFEFSPCTKTIPKTKLSDLKSIAFKNNVVGPTFNENKESDFMKSKLSKLSGDFMRFFVNDVSKLEKLKEAQIISAELYIKFSKPKKMKREEYENITGALLKPIADSDDVEFTTTNGIKMKGSEMLRTKMVKIEMTENGKISEPHLFLEMEKYLNEVINNAN